jgi:hypothetical protein
VWFGVWGKTNGLIAFGLAVVAETAFDFALDVVLLDFEPGISLVLWGPLQEFQSPKLPQ